MAIRLSKKDAENLTKYVFIVKSTQLTRTLAWVDRMGYTAGQYGWYSDVYVFGDVTIISDYHGAHTKRIPRPTEKEIEKIEKRSDAILNNFDLKFYDQQELLTQEREKWFQELIEKYYWEV